MKQVDIFGRYGKCSCSLTKLKQRSYLLTTYGEFTRYGGNDDELIYVDPEGGPFISVGTPLKKIHSELPDKKIVSIENKEGMTIITTE